MTAQPSDLPRRVFLSLGGNLGDREDNMQAALDRLRAGGHLRVLALSRLYETDPVGFTNQPSFLNMAVEAATDLTPLALLDYLKTIEARLGREPTFRNGPRPIDIDIIFYDYLTISEARLTVPHPRLQGRGFVLAPLAELCPEYTHPTLGRSVAQLLAEIDLASSGVRMYAARQALLLPNPSLLFVTGRLAEGWLNSYLDELSRRFDFDYRVIALPVDVAAFLTCRFIAERLRVSSQQVDRVLLPGQASGEPVLVEQATGVKTLRGPVDMAEFEPFLANLVAELSGHPVANPRPFQYTEEQLRLIHSRITDPNVRIYIDRERVFAFNNSVFGSAEPEERALRALFHLFALDSPAHAYYLGREFYKAAICLKLGKMYYQDSEIEGL